MAILNEASVCLAYFMILGVLSHVLGEAVRRETIRFDRFPYAPYRWENGGQFYRKLRIETWKGMLPDKSRFVRTMVRKNLGDDRSGGLIKRLIEETCVAEQVHWLLLFAGPLLQLFSNSAFVRVAGFLYSASNIPFILIQRYNRPRLVALYQKIRMREALWNESADLIQQ